MKIMASLLAVLMFLAASPAAAKSPSGQFFAAPTGDLPAVALDAAKVIEAGFKPKDAGPREPKPKDVKEPKPRDSRDVTEPKPKDAKEPKPKDEEPPKDTETGNGNAGGDGNSNGSANGNGNPAGSPTTTGNDNSPGSGNANPPENPNSNAGGGVAKPDPKKTPAAKDKPVVATAQAPLDQDLALDAVARGEALPLARIVKLAQANWPGRVIDAQLVHVDGVLLYRLTLLSDDGVSRRVYCNAKTGAPVGAR